MSGGFCRPTYSEITARIGQISKQRNNNEKNTTNTTEQTKEDLLMQEEKAGRGLLRKYFPMIRTREEIVKEIQENKRLSKIYEDWKVSSLLS